MKAGSDRYARALERLSSLLRFGVRPGLEAIGGVLASLGHPERQFPSLHIAGTNGKGSTAAFAEAMLREAGARTALYTSPHLVRFTERMRIDGREADPGDVARWIDAVFAAPGGDELTFFEVATAAAFVGFAEAGVDVAVVECGLGGRLDATTTCSPFATVITRIGLDHADVLGDTVEQIAFEKAGIAKAGVPLIVGPLEPEPRKVIEAHAREVGAPVSSLGREFQAAASKAKHEKRGITALDYRGPGGEIDGAILGLAGAWQIENAALALAAVSMAPERFRPDERARRAGLANVRWPARLERVATDLRIDGAHNPDAAAALARELSAEAPVTLLLGMLGDKDVDGVIASLSPIASRIVCTRPASTRAVSAEDLMARVRAIAPNVPVEAIEEPAAALATARAHGGEVVACGSLYLAGALRALVLHEPTDPRAVADPPARPKT